MLLAFRVEEMTDSFMDVFGLFLLPNTPLDDFSLVSVKVRSLFEVYLCSLLHHSSKAVCKYK